MMKQLFFIVPLLGLVLLISCQTEEEPEGIYPTPTLGIDISQNRLQEIQIVDIEQIIQATAVPFDYSNIAEAEEAQRRAEIEAIERIEVTIDTAQAISNISPFIYGLALSEPGVVTTLRPSVYSWTGDGAVRYNILNGRSWNEGREEDYTNVNPFPETGNGALEFFRQVETINAASSFTLPSIGWVAKDDQSCSFLDQATGVCGTGRESTCLSQSVRANPADTSIPISTDDMVGFLQQVQETGASLDFISIMYEPELWGIVHYDLHPECMSYGEVLEIYQTYATAIREVVPDAQLMGPGTCCWEFYFNSAAGREDKVRNDDKDFIPWFLEQMAAFDEEMGQRHLDVLDIHYYPQDLDNDFIDPFVAEHRLRAAYSLYDPLYADESYISEPVQLIPRMNAWIDEFYPGTKLAISAWNFGAQDTLNGALAIAEVLGVYGQEELHYASFFPEIERNTPAYYAFRMYTNVDGFGQTYGNLAVKTESSHPDQLAAFSSLDTETGRLHIMLINQVEKVNQFEVNLTWDGFESNSEGAIYQYLGRDIENFENDQDPGIIGGSQVMGSIQQTVFVPGYSIMHMILEPAPDAVQNQE